MSFKTKLVATPYETGSDGRIRWRLTEPLIYEDITVPAGYRTDFATVPRYMWWWIAPHDCRIAAAAVVHDYIYYKVPREQSAQLFYEAMILLGMPKWKASLCWWWVK